MPLKKHIQRTLKTEVWCFKRSHEALNIPNNDFWLPLTLDLANVIAIKSTGPLDLNPFVGGDKTSFLMKDGSVFVCNIDYDIAEEIYIQFKNQFTINDN